jgi:GMP synthase-like glutamine amidotransferase
VIPAVLVLQHIACEPPGVFEDVMRERGSAIVRVELDEGEPIPDDMVFDAIVVMGGPMGAYDDAEHDWLAGEKRYLAQAAAAGTPIFGACLGAQLLAAALGGRAYPGDQPEVGVLDVELTAAGRDDRVTGALPARFPTLQWHGDTFDLPPGAELLARSPAYPNQAFRWGEAVYAVQFHIEVTEAMAAEWAAVPAYAQALEAVRGPGALDALLADFAARAPEMQRHARALFERWFALVSASAAAA